MAKLEVKVTSGGITFTIDRKVSNGEIYSELLKIATMIKSSFDETDYTTILDNQATSNETCGDGNLDGGDVLIE